MFDYAFEVFVLANELKGSAGTDAFDRVQVVATEENAEVNELCNC